MEVTIVRVYVLAGSACFLGVALVYTTVCWSNIRSRIVALKETEIRYPGYVTSSGEYNINRNISWMNGPASEIFESLVAKAVENLYNNNAHPEEDLMRKIIPDMYTKITGPTPFLKLEDIEYDKRVFVGNTSKVFWKSQHSSSDNNGLRYNESLGNMHVDTAGLYFIMSQIRTKIPATNNTQSSVSVRHLVHHISEKRQSERIIVENVKTLCEPVSTYADQTSTLGAMFKFDAHDQVYVSTSHPSALVANDRSNHVTIFVF